MNLSLFYALGWFLVSDFLLERALEIFWQKSARIYAEWSTETLCVSLCGNEA